MSLILDALRKMEQERKNRLGTAAQDIRPEVLRYRNHAQPEQKKPYLPVALGVTLVAAGLGAGLLVKGAGHPPAGELQPRFAASAPAPAAERAATQEEPSAPAPVPAGEPLPAPAALAPPATQSAPAAQGFLASPAPPPAPSRRAPRTAGAEGALPPAAPASRMPSAGVPAAPVGYGGNPPVPSDFTVSGIAWQDERSLRRAVVNGVLVGEGGEVGGARVLEIRETRVRMSKGGRSFEVEYSSESR